MCPLDEQEQINQQREAIEDLTAGVQVITTLLLGDKLKDPDARSLIEDVQMNRKFRLGIEKKIQKMGAIMGSSILILWVKSFWGSIVNFFTGAPQ